MKALQNDPFGQMPRSLKKRLPVNPSNKSKFRSLMSPAGNVFSLLFCVMVIVLTASSVIAGDDSGATKRWYERIATQYEDAVVKANKQLASAEASVTKCRSILGRAKASGNTNIQDRASKALTEAEGLRKKVLADKVSAQKALSALRGRMAGSDNLEVEGGIITVRKDADDPLGSLKPGDSISTGPDGGADVHMRDDDGMESHVRIGASSRLLLQQGPDEKAPATLLLEQGKLHVTDKIEGPDAETVREKRRSGVDAFLKCLEQTEYSKCLFGYLQHHVRRFEIRTPYHAFAVRGTEYILRYDESTGETILSVIEGEVALCSDIHGQALLVKAGQKARADQNGISLISEPVDVKAENLSKEE